MDGWMDGRKEGGRKDGWMVTLPLQPHVWLQIIGHTVIIENIILFVIEKMKLCTTQLQRSS